MADTPSARTSERSWLEDRVAVFAPRSSARILAALIGAYVLTFLVLPPPGVTVVDENNYIRQAQLILSGRTTLEIEDPFTGQRSEVRPVNDYPLGTAILLVPFVAAGGRDAAQLLSMLCLALGVAITARWLYEAGRSPLWAVLLLAYPVAPVMGRLAMSEAPSLAVVSLGLWLTWRGLRSGAFAFFGAGLLAGASFAFRETNVLLFAPFFLGCLARRDRGAWALLPGGVLGLGLRFGSAAWFFGDPLFTKTPDQFSLDSLVVTLPLYAASLLVLVPGGLVAVALYRGPRARELWGAVCLFVVVHLVYSYTAAESGLVKRLVLGPRYFVPLLPLLAFAAAEAWPRLAERAPDALRDRLASLLRVGVPALLVALGVGLVGVQWVHASWASSQAVIRDAIEEHTGGSSFVVANAKAIGKFVDHVDGGPLLLERARMGAARERQLLARHGAFYLVLLDRTDSEFWRGEARENARYLARMHLERELLLDEQVTPTDRLRIWRVSD